MRHLHSFLYFIGAGALIAGVTDCIAIALGGSAGNHLLALGFVLLSLGSGMRFNGAGHTPPRASFILLGLAGALPLFAGMAPLSAVFATMLFLPLRALGANFGRAIEQHPANTSLLLFCGLLGANIIPGLAVGIPGFLTVWALTGILQRYYFSRTASAANDSDDIESAQLYTPFIGGAAVAMLILLLLPFATVFDYATTANNTLRGNVMLLIFAVIWFSLAAGLADTIAKATVRISAAILAVGSIYFYNFISIFSEPSIYSGFFQNPRILKLANANTPLLAEENGWYIPLVTLFCFVVPLTLLAIFLRCTTNQRRKFAATICGVAAAFIITAIAPRELALSSRLPLATGAFLAALLLSVHYFNHSRRAATITLSASLIGAFLLPVNDIQPTIHLSARGNFAWTAAPGSSKSQLTHVDRYLTYQEKTYYFDGRSPISELPNNYRSYTQSNDFIESLITENDNPVLITKPEQLINSAGNHSLIKLYASAQFNSRRSLLRHELFSQAAMRLSENGLCVLRIASDELRPSVAPQIAQSFRDIFEDSKVYVYSDTLSIPYLIFVGSNSTLSDLSTHAAIEVELIDYTATNSWLLHGPWREVDYLLAANSPVINPEMRQYQLAADVLSELSEFQKPDTLSLLKFFAEHLRAQQYSVHDTYLAAHPLATEASAAALDSLLAATKLHPNSIYLEQLWYSVSTVLIESREITWLEHYFGELRKLDYEHDFVLLGLAHAALESLDFERASSLCRNILQRYPQHSAAAAVLDLAQRKQQVPRDGHVGHNH